MSRLRIVFFGTPEFARADAPRLLDARRSTSSPSSRSRTGRAAAGHKESAAPVKAFADSRGLPVLQPERLKDEAFLDASAGWRPTSASSRPTARSCRERCSTSRGSA